MGDDLAFASCTLISLPNSSGLAALPLRMISVCGSKMLTALARHAGVVLEHALTGLAASLLHAAGIIVSRYCRLASRRA